MNRKGQAVFAGVQGISLIMLCLGALGTIISHTPMAKNFHRTKKAELVCKSEQMGIMPITDEEGNILETIPDRLAHENGLKETIEGIDEYDDFCKEFVSKMTKDQKLDYIKDK